MKYSIDTNFKKLKKYEEIERLKQEYVMLQNASDEVEEEKDKEIKQLQERIDKAIEYIRHTDFVDKGYINFMYELENILRGEDK